MNSQFKQGIKQWIDIDNKVDTLNQQLKLFRQKRDTLGDQLATYIQTNELTKMAFNIDNNRIVYRKEPKYAGLSYDFLCQCAEQYFGDSQKANHFCQFVKGKRQKTYTTCLKKTKPKKKE